MADEVFDVTGSEDAPVLLLRVMAHPGAGRSEVVGQQGDALRVKVAAPPVDGRANRAVVELVAEVLGVKPAQVSIDRGESSRSKRLRIEGVTADQARRLLDAAMGSPPGRGSGQRRRRSGPPPGPAPI